jgi:hypothetical protein
MQALWNDVELPVIRRPRLLAHGLVVPGLSALGLVVLGLSALGSSACATQPPTASTPGTPEAAPAAEAASPSSEGDWVLPVAATTTDSAADVVPYDLEAVMQKLRAEPVNGFVVLAPAARMYRSAESATSAAAPAAPLLLIDTATADGDSPEAGVLLKVAADRGAVVQVTTLTSSRNHCSHSSIPFAFHQYDLTLFVRKADLVPVVRRMLEIPFDDGTGASVAAGVTVGLPMVSWHGEPAISASQIQLEVPLRPSDIGLSYEPARLPGSTGAGPDYRTPDEALWLRGRPWLKRSRYGSPPTLVPSGDLVELAKPCITLFLRSEQPLEVDDRYGGAGMVGGLGGRGRGKKKPPKKVKVMRRYAKAGAKVRWRDGSPAGTVRTRWRMSGGEEIDGMRCYPLKRVPVDSPICLPPTSIDMVEEEIVKP